jgi:hypothetical protein
MFFFNFQGQKGLQNETTAASSQQNHPNFTNDSIDPVNALEKLTIHQVPWNQNRSVSKSITSSKQNYVNQQQAFHSETSGAANETFSNQNQTVVSGGFQPQKINQNQIISTAGTYQPQSNNEILLGPMQNANQSHSSQTHTVSAAGTYQPYPTNQTISGQNQARPIVFTAKPANLPHQKFVSRGAPVAQTRSVLYRTLSTSSSNLNTQSILRTQTSGMNNNNNNNQQLQLERPKSADSFPERRPNSQQEFVDLQNEMVLNNLNVSGSLQAINSQISKIQNQSINQRSQSLNNFRPEINLTFQQRVRPNTGTAVQGKFVNVVNISHMKKTVTTSVQPPQRSENESSITNQQQMQPSNQHPMQRLQSFSNSQQMQSPSTSPQQRMQSPLISYQQQIQRSIINQIQNSQPPQQMFQNQNNQNQMHNNFSNSQTEAPTSNDQMNWRTSAKNSM